MPHATQQATQAGEYDIEDYYNIYSGQGVLNNTARYLRRPANESPRSIQDRSRWASFPNWCKKAHTIYMGYLFATKPKIEPSPEFCILILAQVSGHHALIGGYAWILVMANGPAVYRGDQIIPSGDGKFNVHGTHKSFTIDLNNETITNQDGKQEDFQADQLIKVKWNVDKDSLLVDIAPMNIELFNLNSMKKYHIIRSMHWFLQGPSRVSNPEPFSYVGLNEGEPELSFVQPENSTMVTTIRTEETEIILNMGSILGISSEFARELKFQAGISKMIDLIDTNSIIKQIASQISKACNMAGAAFARLRGGTPATIQIDPILRPTEDSEQRIALKEAAEFINVPSVGKVLQKKYLRLVLGDWTEEELEPLFKDIDAGQGKSFNPLFGATEF